MPRPQLRRGEQTQQEILDAARRLFLTHGFSATSMRQIAGAVGITPAAIYNHFAGKDELFAALLEQAAPFDALFAVWQGADAATPEALVQQVFGQVMELLAGREDYLRLALIDAQERDGATLTTFLPRLFPQALAFYRRLADLDSVHGRMREVPPYVFLRALVSLVVGYLITERVAKPSQTLQLPEVDWARGLTDVFLYGVLNPRETPEPHAGSPDNSRLH